MTSDNFFDIVYLSFCFHSADERERHVDRTIVVISVSVVCLLVILVAGILMSKANKDAQDPFGNSWIPLKKQMPALCMAVVAFAAFCVFMSNGAA